MRIVVGGNDKISCDIVDWLLKSGNSKDIVAIIAEGRDKVSKDEGWEKPFRPYAKVIAARLNVPIFEGNINSHLSALTGLEPDIISPCRTIARVGAEILRVPKKGVTNLHNGLLPKYGGIGVISLAILNGEGTTGVTCHYMGHDFDTGHILEQREIDLTLGNKLLRLPSGREIHVNGKTAFEVYQEANDLSVEIYASVYEKIKKETIQPRLIEPSNGSYYKKGHINFEHDSYINLHFATDEQIARHVRAFTFPPFQMPVGNYFGKIHTLTLEERT